MTGGKSNSTQLLFAPAASAPPAGTIPSPNSSTDRVPAAGSEERSRFLAQISEEIPWAATPDGRQANVLPEWQAFTGQTPDQAAGFGWADAIHPDDREETLRRWRQALATAKPFVLEQRLRRVDGVYRNMQLRAIPQRDSSGKIVEWVGVHSDVTERVQLMEALRQRERELVEAQRIARLGTWYWSIADDTVTWSDEVYRVFEVDPSLPAPKYDRIAALHPPESRALLTAAVQRAVASGEPYVLDVELVFPDGRAKWITARGEVESWLDGRPARLRGTIQEITERKLYERQLSRAHETLANVLNSITDGLAVMDRNWRYTYHSEQGARMVGLTREAILGKSVWEVFPHAVGTRFHRCAHRAVETRRPVHFEEYYPEPLNKWLECHLYPSDEGLSVYFRDITEQRTAEEEKRKSDARFRLFYESDLIGIGFPDRFGAIHDCNDALLRIVGYSREDLQAGRVRWDEMTPPEYAGIDRLRIAQSGERGSCVPYEKEYIRKDGSRVPILCGFGRLNASGEGSIGFVLDLSAQKQAEAALKKREQQFRALAESLPLLIWETGADGRHTYCNQRMLDYTGLTLEEMTGDAGPSKILHPDDLHATTEKWQECLRTGQPYQHQHRLRRFDGAFRYFLARGVPVRDDSGQEIDRWIGSSTDIHDQRLAEEALRRSEKLSTAARFAASVAHEINNPLAAVTNSIYLALLDPDLNPATRNYLQLADQQLARVAQVAVQTLRFHKQSTGPGFANLGQIMDSAFAIFASRFKACGVAVERNYLAFDNLYCYKDDIRQVFANLLSNSLDACPNGGRVAIRIRPRSSWQSPESAGIAVTIADTGHGIPRELKKRIFEPFTTTKVTTGTGLGLWVTEEIVHKHRGRIRVRSSTDRHCHGTVFSLFFPVDGSAPVDGLPRTRHRAD
jgi:PAS domain S-box-containing protein